MFIFRYCKLHNLLYIHSVFMDRSFAISEKFAWFHLFPEIHLLTMTQGQQPSDQATVLYTITSIKLFSSLEEADQYAFIIRVAHSWRGR